MMKFLTLGLAAAIMAVSATSVEACGRRACFRGHKARACCQRAASQCCEAASYSEPIAYNAGCCEAQVYSAQPQSSCCTAGLTQQQQPQPAFDQQAQAGWQQINEGNQSKPLAPVAERSIQQQQQQPTPAPMPEQ